MLAEPRAQVTGPRSAGVVIGGAPCARIFRPRSPAGVAGPIGIHWISAGGTAPGRRYALARVRRLPPPGIRPGARPHAAPWLAPLRARLPAAARPTAKPWRLKVRCRPFFAPALRASQQGRQTQSRDGRSQSCRAHCPRFRSPDHVSLSRPPPKSAYCPFPTPAFGSPQSPLSVVDRASI